jgi:hypothetical protein
MRRAPSYYDDIFGDDIYGGGSVAGRAVGGDVFGASIPRRTAAGLTRRSGTTPLQSPSIVSDARLRGLPQAGLSGMRVGGLTGGGRRGDHAYAVTHSDPYEEVARKEAELGRRMPLPYQAPSALAGQLPMSNDRYQSQYEHLHSEHAVYAAPAVSGRRMTQAGTFGMDQAQVIPWTARDKFGYGRIGARGGGGYDEWWDARNARERRSGRLSDTTRFSQAVDHRFPFLHLVARGVVTVPERTIDGNARVRVTAGLSETGGAEAIREFWIGGGLTARFDMQGWDQVTIEVLDLVDGTNVQFAWVTNGLQASDSQGTLYLPQRVARGGVGIPVPEGAYAIVIEDPALALPGTVVPVTWTTVGAALPGNVTFSVDVDDGASGTTNQFGQRLPVLGTTVDFGGVGTLDVVWFLNSI